MSDTTTTWTGFVADAPDWPAHKATIFDLVKRDLDERDRKGWLEHGRPLAPDAYKDWLREAYDEALDLCVYLRGALAERESK
jgi:hypothetical protein